MPRRKNKLNKNTPQLINIVFTGILSKIKNRWKRNLLFFRKKYFQESGQLGYDGSRGMSSQNFRRAQGAKRKRGSCTADTDFIKMVAFIIYLFFFPARYCFQICCTAPPHCFPNQLYELHRAPVRYQMRNQSPPTGIHLTRYKKDIYTLS